MKPILFNDAMVRAILDGRKTQTRRVMKVQPPFEDAQLALCLSTTGARAEIGKYRWVKVKELSIVDSLDIYFPFPFGKVGDQLWVRETWGNVSYSFDDDGFSKGWIPTRPAKAINEMPFGGGYYDGHVIYRADGEFEWCGDDDGGGEPRSAWHPSIHMPREASRIQLEITSIRIERLQEISEEDAIAEGARPIECDHIRRSCEDIGCYGDTAKASFRGIWESTGGDWNANPWVWVIEFKRVEVAA